MAFQKVKWLLNIWEKGPNFPILAASVDQPRGILFAGFHKYCTADILGVAPVHPPDAEAVVLLLVPQSCSLVP